MSSGAGTIGEGARGDVFDDGDTLEEVVAEGDGLPLGEESLLL